MSFIVATFERASCLQIVGLWSEDQMRAVNKEKEDHSGNSELSQTRSFQHNFHSAARAAIVLLFLFFFGSEIRFGRSSSVCPLSGGGKGSAQYSLGVCAFPEVHFGTKVARFAQICFGGGVVWFEEGIRFAQIFTGPQLGSIRFCAVYILGGLVPVR